MTMHSIGGETAYASELLGDTGLYIGREVASSKVEEAVTWTARELPYFYARDHFHVNELDMRDVLDQAPIEEVKIGDAQKRILEHVGSLGTDVTVDIENVDTIKRRGKPELVIINFTYPDQKRILRERRRILAAIESFALDGHYDWARYAAPGVIVGSAPPSCDQERRDEITGRIREGIGDRLLLTEAQFLPEIVDDPK